ncbi:MAG: DUF6268 family outer membrane beta-barrel protein [Planctomycetes bacterium]|nr:DUF6268 family outer membrane beta-barrel protein [Planctomycetota bacterium]
MHHASASIPVLLTLATTASAGGGHVKSDGASPAPLESELSLDSDSALALIGTDEAVAPRTRVVQQPKLWNVTVKATSYASADFADIDDELEVSRLGVDVGHTLLGQGGVWSLRIGGEQSKYETSNAVFDDADEFGFGATYFRPGSSWSWFATLNANSGTSEGADFGESFYFEGGAGFVYAFSKDLQLGLGIVGRNELEDDVSFSPIPMIEWAITEHGHIGTVRSSDPSLGFTYNFTDHCDGYIQLQMQQRQYRVDDDVLAHAAFIDEETGVRIGGIYRSDAGLQAELFLGATDRRLSIDVDGDEIADEDIDTAGFVGASLSFAF